MYIKTYYNQVVVTPSEDDEDEIHIAWADVNVIRRNTFGWGYNLVGKVEIDGEKVTVDRCFKHVGKNNDHWFADPAWIEKRKREGKL